MTKEKEPYSLFPKEFPNTPKLSLETIKAEASEAARKIAEAAAARGPIEYPDRTSEAARDQGRGVIDISTVPEEIPGERSAAKARGTHPSMGTIKPLPQRGINRESRHGDSERDTEGPDYHKPAPKPLTPEEIETNVRRLPGAREAITAGPEDNDPDAQSTTNQSKLTPEEIAIGQERIDNIRDILDAKKK